MVRANASTRVSQATMKGVKYGKWWGKKVLLGLRDYEKHKAIAAPE